MTAKELLLERAPHWSEHDAEVALRAVEREHDGKDVDEWGDVDAQTEALFVDSMRALADEEREELGETIGEAWRRQRPA